MELGNNQEIQAILRGFKLPTGSPNFLALYNIPNKDRVRDMAIVDFNRVNMLIIGALTVVFEGMNLKRGMNEIQILSLSELIIDSAGEDNFSFEDFMIFLQNMLAGKYEMSYESMDIPKFMRLFELYREERWQNWVTHKDNEHLQYKGLGDANRTGKADPLAEHFSRMASTISAMKENMKELRTENRTMKQADKFYKDK